MLGKDIPKIIKILRAEAKRFRTPYVTEVSKGLRKDPFNVLVSCILSLRTKDSTTRNASVRLFKKASTPERLSRLSTAVIERLIYPAGFYRVKARVLKNISKELVEKYSSKVPDTIEGLLKFKGVGRKTANLVVTMGYGHPGICVDTHVHRIVNRWGYVASKTTDETEAALRKKLAKRYWIEFNDLLVTYGQNICRPVSPFCSVCAIAPYCLKKGVISKR
ncbi:MAG: endonuclease III [Deltaproteobacteria bacterium]|nr:endonuclease III [Deltaproteobacteria bacterium]